MGHDMWGNWWRLMEIKEGEYIGVYLKGLAIRPIF